MSADSQRADRDDRQRGNRRGPGRFLAPLALIVVIVAMIVIITRASAGSTSSPTQAPAPAPVTTQANPVSRTSTRAQTSTQSATATSTSSSTTTTTTTVTGTGGTYTIASGDTFSVISEKTGVPISTLEALNPGVSSSALTVGEVIKLK
jgi:LysM repeat protein